jgi:hypothetical protein
MPGTEQTAVCALSGVHRVPANTTLTVPHLVTGSEVLPTSSRLAIPTWSPEALSGSDPARA